MVTIERVLSEYAKLGYFDARNLFDADGKPIPIQDLDDETAGALMGLDIQEVYEGTGEDRKFVGYTKKYKLPDKKAALDSMAKYLGMFTDKESSPANINIISSLSDAEIESKLAEMGYKKE
jgi:phage terminase small subunit